MIDNGTFGKVNHLSYGYDGNRLVSVSNAVIAPSYNGFFGFIDGADKAVEYEYDANGNMIRDWNKGISFITYNVGNLPLSIQYMNGSRATYRYTADGTKLQVRYDTSYAGLLSNGSQGGIGSKAIAQTHTIDYVGNRIYEDGRLDKILVDGGYVDYNGGKPVYNAYLTDHQGNIRMVVSESAAVRQVANYYPYGALMVENTGVNVQRYTYNGKELDRMHGLDWYDYGARHYDATIGRWHSMDDMCHAYYDISPYAYCGCDPVNAVDPSGKVVIGMDELAQQNIIYTLTEDEAKFIRFNEERILDAELLNQSSSTSENMTALKSVVNSETNYFVAVASNYKLGNDVVEMFNNPKLGVVGTTMIPGANVEPSPDNDVHIFTSNKLSIEGMVENTAHELYGHGYFYELQQHGIDVNPYHSKTTVDNYMEYDEEFNMYIPVLTAGRVNELLERQIQKVSQQAIYNFRKRK